MDVFSAFPVQRKRNRRFARTKILDREGEYPVPENRYAINNGNRGFADRLFIHHDSDHRRGGAAFIIIPAFFWLGVPLKEAMATALGHINVPLLTFSALGSIAGAYLGAWLMVRKLQSAQVKTIIGVVLYLIAAKMLWGLVG